MWDHISLLCFARPSTRVGRQWLVKIRLHRLQKAEEGAHRLTFLHQVNAVLAATTPSLYLQLFQQLVVVSNRSLQCLQELLLCLQLFCHRTRPPASQNSEGKQYLQNVELNRPCSCLCVLCLTYVGEAWSARVRWLHPEHSALTVPVYPLLKLHLVHLKHGTLDSYINFLCVYLTLHS